MLHIMKGETGTVNTYELRNTIKKKLRQTPFHIKIVEEQAKLFSRTITCTMI